MWIGVFRGRSVGMRLLLVSVVAIVNLSVVHNATTAHTLRLLRLPTKRFFEDLANPLRGFAVAIGVRQC
jgi:hypothetical protein